LQANNSDAPAVRAALADSRDRVRSIALVHDQLYRAAAGVSSIDLVAYLRQLIVYIERTLTDGRLRIDLVGESMTLSLDKAVPCGVVVNELITNAVKHAFPNGRAGTITVSARVHGETAVIAVEDDGVGLPPGFDPAMGTGLGMTIVSTLAAQLEGCLEVRPSRGGTVELRFPVAHR
jgi:two-component sensor histidine kinase